jgi:hypothetical protein
MGRLALIAVDHWKNKMPLIGDLSEFPLPEVLLLIGSRTGRLRLYDAPGIVPMTIDLSAAHAHGLHIDETFLTETRQIVAELSFLVETGEGRFEFTAQPVVAVKNDCPLPISELVMLLVLHVDEKLAKQNAVLAPQLFYILENPPPSVEINPNLNLFLQQSKQLLAGGVRSEDLAEYLGIPEETVRLNLYNLHQMNFVTLIETSDVETLREMMVEQEISMKSNEFLLAVEASDLIRRSGKLLKLPSMK